MSTNPHHSDMPLPTNSAAENALATIGTSRPAPPVRGTYAAGNCPLRHFRRLRRPGTVCWTVQLIPQVWKSWRAKSTDGLSHWLVYVPRACFTMDSFLLSVSMDGW